MPLRRSLSLWDSISENLDSLVRWFPFDAGSRGRRSKFGDLGKSSQSLTTVSTKKMISMFQRRTAETAIGASTGRGMGPSGTIGAARSYLAELDLHQFRTRSEQGYLENLNEVTRSLQRALPPGGKYWGSARKFINIFLRDCLYNRYLCEHFELQQVESLLELPLDKHTATGLSSEFDLPRWPGVIRLSPEESSQYQMAATSVAIAKGTPRVHLDLWYWRASRQLGL